ncbi:MAG: hypothetical protein IJM79_02285 [Erysipelotrichaceae bacterium]|nr:hypothetical protein [Erysipelotrichaceae bacterium]
MLKMKLDIGEFEFSIDGVMDEYNYDPITNEEKKLLQTNVVATIGLKSDIMDFSWQCDNFVSVNEYDLMIKGMTAICEKPNFYNLDFGPAIKILSVPYVLNEGETEMDFAEVFSKKEDYEPYMALCIQLESDEGFSSSSMHIVFNEEQTRQFANYLKTKRESLYEHQIIS